MKQFMKISEKLGPGTGLRYLYLKGKGKISVHWPLLMYILCREGPPARGPVVARGSPAGEQDVPGAQGILTHSPPYIYSSLVLYSTFWRSPWGSYLFGAPLSCGGRDKDAQNFEERAQRSSIVYTIVYICRIQWLYLQFTMQITPQCSPPLSPARQKWQSCAFRGKITRSFFFFLYHIHWKAQ